MPLTPATKAILSRIRKLQPDNQEFIFYRGDSPLATVTFNRRLKKCCEDLGIEYRSSHKLRFSTASIMYKNGMEDTALQKLLGHTTLAYSAESAHPFRRNGAPFRFKLSSAQIVN